MARAVLGPAVDDLLRVCDAVIRDLAPTDTRDLQAACNAVREALDRPATYDDYEPTDAEMGYAGDGVFPDNH